ncbi:hypothetical protein [Streptomyces sp. LN785]|uniref:hypothetical protein n=1 Tax=Streptomyces sp. LN785 TaxID=3112983 RepID=UPI00371F044F
MPFPQFDTGIRHVVCNTGVIESVNARVSRLLVAQRICASEIEANQTLTATERGDFGALLTERWSPDDMLMRGKEPVGDPHPPLPAGRRRT